MKYFHLLFFLLLFFIPSTTSAQNDLTLDEYVFICDSSLESVEEKLINGVNAFSIEIEESNGEFITANSKNRSELKTVLNPIKEFIESNDSALISLILKGSTNNESISAYLKLYFAQQVHFTSDGHWSKIDSLKNGNQNVVVFFETDVVHTDINKIRNNRYQDRFSSGPLNKLISFNSIASNDKILLKESLELWKSTGKPPNFIHSTSVGINRQKAVADSLNNLRRFRGIVQYNNQALNEIYWAKSPGVITPSKFSFPLTEDTQILSPYKNGFRITPAEVIHHSAQSDVPRIFSAYNIDLDNQLIYEFFFENKITNTRDEQWDRFISQDINFKKDAERGKVLHLTKPNSFIDYSRENNLNFKTPISIASWIKPDSIKPYMGILGFGVAFSLKLKDGYPDFTAATIKDHIIEKRLNVGEWYHLVTVYNPKSTIDFYLNGEKIGESITENVLSSDQSLVIGNNVWGEQFYGSIDDLKIWNRGLSPNEVKSLYQTHINNKTNDIYIIISLFVLSIGIIFYLKGKKVISNQQKTIKRRILLETTPKTENRLTLFGNFEFYFMNAKVNSPKLSPLQRQILSYLILASLDNHEGTSTNKLTETFWPGVSKQKAKENRNSNIRKLRMALSEVKGIEILFEEKKWKVINTSDLKIDIFEYNLYKSTLKSNLVKGEISIITLECYLQLTQRGNILQNTQKEWADIFKNKLSNEIESLLLKIHKNHFKVLPSEIIIQMAQTILQFDNLNEDALQILVSELTSTGKHGQAKNIYTTFSRNYQSLYDELFEVDFQELVKKPDSFQN